MLSKTAEYALRAVAMLANQPGRPALADQLAEKTLIPRRYLNRVLQDLVSAGLLRSRPGRGGGYELTKGARDVSILEVVNAVSPLERIRQCPLGLATHTSLCPLHAELDRAYAATEKAFAGVTMAQVLASTKGIVPLCESANSNSKNAKIEQPAKAVETRKSRNGFKIAKNVNSEKSLKSGKSIKTERFAKAAKTVSGKGPASARASVRKDS